MLEFFQSVIFPADARTVYTGNTDIWQDISTLKRLIWVPFIQYVIVLCICRTINPCFLCFINTWRVFFIQSFSSKHCPVYISIGTINQNIILLYSRSHWLYAKLSPITHLYILSLMYANVSLFQPFNVPIRGW